MDSTDLFDNQNIREVSRGRKESHVWDHYFKEPLGSVHYTARCHYCNQNWSRGKPEILKSHLALYCKDVPLYIKTEYMEMLAVGTTSTMNRKQKTDSDSSAELTVDRKDKIDQALIRFFICCGIPFSTVGHPYFIDFVQSLCFAYGPPKRTTLSTTFLNHETAIILNKIKEELKYEKNLTLGRSIYAFIIITPSKRQYIHTLKDTSMDSHTGTFNATEIEKVLTSIGLEKFAAVVSDAESAMQMARRLITENDIIKLDFAINTLKKCQSIITFFKTSYRAGANFQKDIIQTLTEGGGLKTSVFETQTEIFINAIAIKNLLLNRQFFQDVEQLHTILAPAKKAIQAVEANSSNMASIFLQLIQMAVEIKKISNYFDPNFKKNCINIFNKRWAQFDTDTYLVAFFLHPRYRDKKFQDSTFRQMALTAMKIWSKFGSDKRSCKILLSQLRSYGDNEPPYDMEYTDEYDTPELWWSTCRQPNNYIQKLALKLFAITPHQAACERAFSVLNWMIGKRRTRLDIDRLQSMVQMHSYYITNAKSELKFSSSDLSENELETALQEITTAMINNDDIFIDDDDIVLDDESIDLNDDDANTNDLIMENIMNLDSFNEQNDDNSNSNISDQQPDESINYEDSNIDFEAIFD
ncbi:ribonuclease H-like domain-containing protein [Rhizophagus irregularis DAOM 181602=DAOM 197198]|uniref:Ribonuclease H-like domain-containing protein n=1 Tax=Rhizophagus irregularis (strain DAOM 181602 / DAOM 197198 / MUCL 43194) TaxID=747089 RepID=A0A2P4Q336_RHIID|nr:ribonuclease H-like domain-containing protein [Rhizophagus irregularis DAOM 181602=DAOM 197198]POG72040.1 ribonuclease H-like domain-containing protein [Rhizophagus irregularis DAOM 181602=DAOM 197198]|eukprot:XP_025178906.1 ribonuclease H-like domain-containing protein [Rhizophagus irregularis DAOM 181602=DAOM 197198]